jgi:ribonuclease HII
MIVGVDEVARGCLAGPVMAAAVAFKSAAPAGLRDSKRLSPRQRDSLDLQIRETCHISIGLVEAVEIDRINILQATMLAMQIAVDGLPAELPISRIMVDGNRAPALSRTAPVETVIGGDDLVAEISAASIIAKVARDRLIISLHEQHPHYDWASNKGYGSPKHLAAIATHGPSPHHRMSFAPLRQPSLF